MRYVVHVLKRFVAVVTMACLSSSRFCARVQDKLMCQFGHKVRKQTVFVKLKPPGPSPLRIFGRTYQRVTTCGPACGPTATAAITPTTAATATTAVVRRLASSLQSTSTGSLPDYGTQIVDPYRLLEDDLNGIYEDIRSELERNTNQAELNTIATYYFDGQGKALRPMVAILMARAVNYHVYGENSALLPSQRQVAMISEMIHSASLIHDDVIDQSDFRRGKPSVNVLWNHKKVAMAGDFILAVASMMIARLRSDDVTLVLSQVVTDLVQGEFMQLGSKETENERFAHYLTKTYRKTASLIANSVKAVALLSGADESTCELAFQYGRNLGLAFQLVDDLLDFVSSAQAMGKPTAADLKLGLATAPVLFACEKYPELNPMIMRRFAEAGDVEKAFELVHKSRGLEQTRFLARKHGAEAARRAADLADSPYQKGLVVTADLVLNRIKRLTAPSSGSLRRRVRERLRAGKTRAEGERLALERREQRAREKIESQRKAREELATYEPWGRAGGGAPNPQGVRFSNIRATGIFPEDELRGISIYEACRKWTSTQQRRKRQTPIRLREDPQLCYAENLRKSVDNDIRYKRSPNQQLLYKQDLDHMIEQRRKATKEEIEKDLEYDQKLLNMDGPWGKPGPGGTIWRHPRNIGLNFSKSMGWTDNEIFNKLKWDQKGAKRSSLTLPKVKRDDDTQGDTRDKENIKPSIVDKLPHIPYNDSPNGSGRDARREMNEKVKTIYSTNRNNKRSPKKKNIKRLSYGDKVSRVCLDDYDNNYNEGDVATQKKPTPEATLLRVTGGVELVPLLARRRRVGARTLPSSDVTRPPEQPCQWRELEIDYLRELKHQMRVKCEQKEESRRNSAESVKQHHATWASLWGRPGHGAPQQRGRCARSNLAQLLYVQPLSHTQ